MEYEKGGNTYIFLPHSCDTDGSSQLANIFKRVGDQESHVVE